MQFIMAPTKSDFGANNFPVTEIADNIIVLNPLIDGGEMSFKGNKSIRIYSNQNDVDYFYTTDGSFPSVSSKKYEQPFTINTSANIKAIAVNKKGEKSFVTNAVYKESPHHWSIQLNTAFEPQYEAGGAPGLIDGIEGSTNWRKGNWQGYQKIDIDAVIDLQEIKTISTVTAGFLQDTRAWIVMPKELIIEVSTDGKTFIKVFSTENILPVTDLTVQIKKVLAKFSAIAARFVRIKAIQFGKLPAWHEGAGGDTHIFIDEINIE